MRLKILFCFFFLTFLFSELTFADSFVIPKRMGKNSVFYKPYSWKYVDFLQSSLSPKKNQGRLRLYFYDREKSLAEIAAYQVIETISDLEKEFQFSLPYDFHYILYNSHHEFKENNTMEVDENVLGVTNTFDLSMMLPYWGEHQRFRQVNYHEMVHEFTLQKLMKIKNDMQCDGSLSFRFPLWFIEGMAEYYSQKGDIDGESLVVIKDVIFHPVPERGYIVENFFGNNDYNYLDTYKIGQLKILFLTKSYGKEIIQNILDYSYLLSNCANGPKEDALSFEKYLELILKNSSNQINQKWEHFLKTNFFQEYYQSIDFSYDYEEIPLEDHIVDQVIIHPNGNTIAFRAFHIPSEHEIYGLYDKRDPDSLQIITENHWPESEMLYFLKRDSLAMFENTLLYTAQNGATDSLFIQTYNQQVETSTETALSRIYPAYMLEKKPEKFIQNEIPNNELRYKTLFSLVHKKELPCPDSVIEIGYPILRYNKNLKNYQIAFTGLNENGFVNIYYYQLDDNFNVLQSKQLTDTQYSKKELSWFADKNTQKVFILFASDYHSINNYNIYAIDPDNEQIQAITTFQSNQSYPIQGTDNNLYFVSDIHHKFDVFSLASDQVLSNSNTTKKIYQITDHPTGIIRSIPFNNQLYSIVLESGKYKIAVKPISESIYIPTEFPEIAWSHKIVFPKLELSDAYDYSAYNLKNWRFLSAYVLLSSQFTSEAFLSFSDIMKNHIMLVSFGSYIRKFDLTEFQMLYFNREQKWSWGFGPYKELIPDTDADPLSLAASSDYYIFFRDNLGVSSIVQYPFSRYLALAFHSSYFHFRQLAVNANSLYGFSESPEIIERSEIPSQWALSFGMQFGRDTVNYQIETGPIEGFSYLLDTEAAYFLDGKQWRYQISADVQHFWKIYSRVNWSTKLALGVSSSGQYGQKFYISSMDYLRGIPFFDESLFGYHYSAFGGELQFPLNMIVRSIFFQDLEGVLGFDTGSAFDDFSDFEQRFSFAGVYGFNFRLNHLILRLHFGIPIVTPTDTKSPILNLSLRYFFQ